MEKYLKPITQNVTEKILEQMNNTSFRINQKNENILFFFLINYQNQKIPFIIINNYLKDEDIKDSIDLLINNEIKKIELSEIIYKNKEYNITIIIMKNNESNNNIKYIEIDNNILYKKESEIKYRKESIYILQYKNIEDILISYGVINKINKEKIRYSGNINQNSKYTLIFDLNNNKLIGMHKNYFNSYNNRINFLTIIKKLIL